MIHLNDYMIQTKVSMAPTEVHLTPHDMYFRESLVCHRQQYNGVYIPQIHSLQSEVSVRSFDQICICCAMKTCQLTVVLSFAEHGDTSQNNVLYTLQRSCGNPEMEN